MAASPEQKKSYQVIKNFKGIDTRANRTAISEDEFSWVENAQPIGFGNLRIIPAQTAALNSSGNAVVFGNTVSYLNSVNLGLNDYVIAFKSDGGAEYYNVETLTQGTIAAPGTFSDAGVTITQWENTQVLILDPYLGYFCWDGTHLVQIGSIGSIGITNPGANYTSAPTVTVSAPSNANGVNATLVSSITTGSGGVLNITMSNIGSGYTSVPAVTISAPNATGGTQATATATIQSGNVVAIGVTNPGSGYTSPPTVTITGGGGTSAAANATISVGTVNAVAITDAGYGYTTSPTITFSGGGGTNAAAIASVLTFAYGTLSLFVENGGSGYTNAANVVITISGGGGSNAAGTAIVSGGTITEVIMTNNGTGYTNASNVTVTVSGGGGSGAILTPIVNNNINTSIATFSGRVWIASGRTVYYSAAGSFSDFSSVSAGSITITDSTLHGNIQYLLSANNFLYIFGDDSINVFSDVIVQSNGTTVFTNTNVSASVGSKRPFAIFPYFRSVLFMNDYGIYALVGSTTSKLSDPLDGIIPNIDYSSPIYGGQVLLNNILCAAFNFRYYDAQFTQSYRYIQAIFFEKKWFITSQGNSLYAITSAPVNGKVVLFGVSGSSLYQLYENNTANVASIVQTALLPMTDPIRTKQALKFGIEATLTTGGLINLTVDSEIGSSAPVALQNTDGWTNNNGQTIPWINNSSVVISWSFVSGYNLYKGDAQQWGKYLGFTMKSNSPNFVYNTFEFEHELRVRF